MIELVLTLRAIQTSFMVYNWTMAMQFTFKYCIEPRTTNLRRISRQSAVYKNRQDMCSDSPNRMKKLAGSSSQDGGKPSEDFKLLQLCWLECQHTTYTVNVQKPDVRLAKPDKNYKSYQLTQVLYFYQIWTFL